MRLHCKGRVDLLAVPPCLSGLLIARGLTTLFDDNGITGPD